MSALATDAGVEILPAKERVVARLFLPGESTPGSSSRTEGVLGRVLSAPADALAVHARLIRDRFGERHTALMATFGENAAIVQAPDAPPLSDDATIVVGAAFTAEYSVEGAALCNPSAVAHPDQSDLEPGQLRVMLTVRSIGEGHFSSAQLCEAVIGPGRTWRFLPRHAPLQLAAIAEGEWSREHLLRALAHDGQTDELVRSIGQVLPGRFGSSLVEDAVRTVRTPLMHHPGARAQLDAIRVVAGSAYRATFPEGSEISARVLLPVADEEHQGIEDVRLVRVEDHDGGHEYRGTFTAYDGRSIGSRLLTTTDFRAFAVHRLTGPPARTKGMALFPRSVGGTHVALSRTGGESIGLSRSPDGLDWSAEEPLHGPTELWDIVQGGNCGSPIETSRGWLVLTHGVGPMRVYSIGAILLDLDDPARVIGVLPGPLIEPRGAAGSGYVPNVVYSCGGIVHDGVLWIPHGVADDRIRVASVPVDALLAAMRPPRTSEPSRTSEASRSRPSP